MYAEMTWPEIGVLSKHDRPTSVLREEHPPRKTRRLDTKIGRGPLRVHRDVMVVYKIQIIGALIPTDMTDLGDEVRKASTVLKHMLSLVCLTHDIDFCDMVEEENVDHRGSLR